jgi:hypothetical protein
VRVARQPNGGASIAKGKGPSFADIVDQPTIDPYTHKSTGGFDDDRLMHGGAVDPSAARHAES